MPEAKSICAITQPPKMSPAAFVSPGMASVLSVSSPRGAAVSSTMAAQFLSANPEGHLKAKSRPDATAGPHAVSTPRAM
jgi:hypothetical protein